MADVHCHITTTIPHQRHLSFYLPNATMSRPRCHRLYDAVALYYVNLHSPVISVSTLSAIVYTRDLCAVHHIDQPASHHICQVKREKYVCIIMTDNDDDDSDDILFEM